MFRPVWKTFSFCLKTKETKNHVLGGYLDLQTSLFFFFSLLCVVSTNVSCISSRKGLCMDNIQPELLGLDLFWLYPGVVHSVLCIPTVLVRVPGPTRVLKLWPSRPRGHDFGVPKWRSNYVWKSHGTLTWWLKTVLPFQERNTWMFFDSTRESPIISVGSRCFIFSPSAVPAVRPGRVPGWFRIRAPAASMWWRPLPPCWCWGRLRRSSTRSAARSKGCGARRLELLRCLKVLSYVIIWCYRYLTLFHYTESLWIEWSWNILNHKWRRMLKCVTPSCATRWVDEGPAAQQIELLLKGQSELLLGSHWCSAPWPRGPHVKASALGRCLWFFGGRQDCQKFSRWGSQFGQFMLFSLCFFSQNPKGGRNPAFCAKTQGYLEAISIPV